MASNSLLQVFCCVHFLIDLPSHSVMRWILTIGLLIHQPRVRTSKSQLIGQLSQKTIVGRNNKNKNFVNISWDVKRFLSNQISDGIMPFGVNRQKLVKWYNKINSRIMFCDDQTNITCKCSLETSEYDRLTQVSWENATQMVNILLLTAADDFYCDSMIQNPSNLRNFWWNNFKHSEGNCSEVIREDTVFKLEDNYLPKPPHHPILRKSSKMFLQIIIFRCFFCSRL